MVTCSILILNTASEQGAPLRVKICSQTLPAIFVNFIAQSINLKKTEMLTLKSEINI